MVSRVLKDKEAFWKRTGNAMKLLIYWVKIWPYTFKDFTQPRITEKYATWEKKCNKIKKINTCIENQLACLCNMPTTANQPTDNQNTQIVAFVAWRLCKYALALLKLVATTKTPHCRKNDACHMHICTCVASIVDCRQNKEDK